MKIIKFLKDEWREILIGILGISLILIIMNYKGVFTI